MILILSLLFAVPCDTVEGDNSTVVEAVHTANVADSTTVSNAIVHDNTTAVDVSTASNTTAVTTAITANTQSALARLIPDRSPITWSYTADPSAPAKCIAALGQNQLGGGTTCHHTYNKETPGSAGFGGCDYAKSSQGGPKDQELVWAFARKKGFMVKGGGNCFDIVRLTFNGKSVDLVVLDNGTPNDISIPAYHALTGVEAGPNCEDAVCPIGNVQSQIVGNCKAEFAEFAKSYPNTVIELQY